MKIVDPEKLCRVPNKIHSAKQNTRQNASLPNAFFWHSAIMYFAECYFSAHDKMRLCRVLFSGTRQRCILPRAIFRHTAKCVFAEWLFSGTRRRCILPSAFVLALVKAAFCRVHFLALGKSVFQSNF